jgi:hypothetical protein
MKAIQITFCVLVAIVVSLVGCVTPARHADPLAGWQFSSLTNLDTNKAITDDYQDYIQKLSPEERKRLGIVKFFADGTGQHAVKIEVGFKGTWWEHVLIYNKDNKRIKRIKYSSGAYRS